jgi:lipopolysaccharide transport system permease protein/teichoic acid transport system permease protein
MATLSEPAAGTHLTPPARRGIVRLTRDGFGEMTGRWRLVRYLVAADLKRTHADTALGQAWWLLDPILQMLVYYFLFAVIFQRQTEDFLLFLFAAILPWKWFTTTVNNGMNSVVGRQGLIRQVQFPKLVLPTAATVAEVFSFAIGLIALAFLFIPYHDRLSIWVLTIPLIAVVQFVFGLAVAILLAAANAFYRDVANVMSHLLRLLFYVSPALYAMWEVPNEQLQTLMLLNPFTTLLTAYRTVTWGTETVHHGTRPDFLALGILLVISSLLVVLAVALFKRVEPAFARIL